MPLVVFLFISVILLEFSIAFRDLTFASSLKKSKESNFLFTTPVKEGSRFWDESKTPLISRILSPINLIVILGITGLSFLSFV